MKKSLLVFVCSLVSASAGAAGLNYVCEGSDKVQVVANGPRVSVNGHATLTKRKVTAISGEIGTGRRVARQGRGGSRTPSYPSYPNFSSYAETPSYPSYPDGPSYPSYPGAPSYPGTPSYEFPLLRKHKLNFSAGVDAKGRLTFISGKMNGKTLLYNQRTAKRDLKNKEVRAMFAEVAAALKAFQVAGHCCVKPDAGRACGAFTTSKERALPGQKGTKTKR